MLYKNIKGEVNSESQRALEETFKTKLKLPLHVSPTTNLCFVET